MDTIQIHQLLKDIINEQKIIADKVARIERNLIRYTSEQKPLALAVANEQQAITEKIIKIEKDMLTKSNNSNEQLATISSEDQKIMADKIATIERDLEISVNGYKPHQVVALLHYVDQLRDKNTKRHDYIRNAVVNWTIPIILSALLIGLFEKYK